ncbi:hypothetical protein NUW54_g4875 [Trametes sanguinea]|uniref:Uncharacterized protein n=1 Tax=Trametes sanguinea TaxID=158606 RepID=A0ACC1PYA2_9APHY|nr:hypothetical protein NUW54_g4875 [Trametes sanguinea]
MNPIIPTDVEQSRPVLGHVFVGQRADGRYAHRQRVTRRVGPIPIDPARATNSVFSLRSFARATLASSPPDVAVTFTKAARSHLAKTGAMRPPAAGTLFVQLEGEWEPTDELSGVLSRCRMLYGAGMGVNALTVLTDVVKESVGVTWKEDSRMEEMLALVDTDLCQAIQSAKEEMDRVGGKGADVEAARKAREKLRDALMASREDARRLVEAVITTSSPQELLIIEHDLNTDGPNVQASTKTADAAVSSDDAARPTNEPKPMGADSTPAPFAVLDCDALCVLSVASWVTVEGWEPSATHTGDQREFPLRELRVAQ